MRQRADNPRFLQQRGDALAAQPGFESRQDRLQRDLAPKASVGRQIDGALEPWPRIDRISNRPMNRRLFAAADVSGLRTAWLAESDDRPRRQPALPRKGGKAVAN